MDPRQLRIFARSCIVFFLLWPQALPATKDVQPRQPGPRDACPVCGMFVAPYPEWIAQVVFEDGSLIFFDGSKDMFKYLLDRGRFSPDKQHLEIAASFVTGYYGGKTIPARRAHFVIGSDVFGPMGPELVPHKTAEEAEEFLEDHKGSRVVVFADVTAELLRSLGKHSER